MMNGAIAEDIFSVLSDEGATLPEMYFAGGVAEHVTHVGNTQETPAVLQNLDSAWPLLERELLKPPVAQDSAVEIIVEPGETVLTHAVKMGDCEAVKWLLNVPGLNVDAHDSSGRNALNWADAIADAKTRKTIQKSLQMHARPGSHEASELTRGPLGDASMASSSMARAYLADFQMPPPSCDSAAAMQASLSDLRNEHHSVHARGQAAGRGQDVADAGHELLRTDWKEWARNDWQQEWTDASLEQIEVWLQRDASAGVVNLRNLQGETVLIRAVKAGQSKIVDALLKLRQTDVNAMDYEGGTALNWAVSYGGQTGRRCVESLLRHTDIDIDLGDPLEWALYYGHTQIADLLRMAKEHGRHGMARRHNMHCAEQDDELGGEHDVRRAISVSSDSGASALPREAARSPARPAHMRTLQYSASRDVADGGSCLLPTESGWHKKIPGRAIDVSRWIACYQNLSTPRKLNMARQFSCLPSLERRQFWIRHAIGGDVLTIQFFRASHTEAAIYNERNSNGETALTVAVANDSLAVVEELLSIASVDVNLTDAQGNTPLKLAVNNDNVEIVNLLLQRKDLNPNASHVLLLAAQKACVRVMGSLLQDARVRINMVMRGATALSTAAESGHDNIVRMLAMHAQIDMNAGQPLQQAIKRRHARIVRILVADTRVWLDASHLALAKKAGERQPGVAAGKNRQIAQRASMEIIKYVQDALQARAKPGRGITLRSSVGNTAPPGRY